MINIWTPLSNREDDSPPMVTRQLIIYQHLLLLIVYFLFVFLPPSEDAFKAPQRSVDKPFRLCVSDVFKGKIKNDHGLLFSFHFLNFTLIAESLLMLHFLFPDQGSGFCVTGKIEAGYIQTGDKILAMPPNEACTVKGMH